MLRSVLKTYSMVTREDADNIIAALKTSFKERPELPEHEVHPSDQKVIEDILRDAELTEYLAAYIREAADPKYAQWLLYLLAETAHTSCCHWPWVSDFVDWGLHRAYHLEQDGMLQCLLWWRLEPLSDLVLNFDVKIQRRCRKEDNPGSVLAGLREKSMRVLQTLADQEDYEAYGTAEDDKPSRLPEQRSIRDYTKGPWFVDKADKRITVCVDFDGVLHSYEEGWQGPSVIPGKPVEDAMGWLEWLLSDGFRVVIFSSRCRDPEGLEAMQKWMRKYASATVYDFVEYSDTKVPAHMIIDDRAFEFRGLFPTPQYIRDFKPWNR